MDIKTCKVKFIGTQETSNKEYMLASIPDLIGSQLYMYIQNDYETAESGEITVTEYDLTEIETNILNSEKFEVYDFDGLLIGTYNKYNSIITLAKSYLGDYRINVVLASSSLEDQVSDLQQNVTYYLNYMRGYEAQRDDLESKAETLASSITSTNSRIDNITTVMDEFAARMTTLETQLNSLQKTSSTTEDTVA